MGQFDRQIATAKRLIAKNGQAVTWRRTTDAAPADSAKPWKPGTSTVIDTPVTIIFLPEDRRDFEFLRLLGATEVPKGKLVGLMAAVGFTPTIKDTVIRAGVSLGIDAIDPLAPNGQIILYTVRFAI